MRQSIVRIGGVEASDGGFLRDCILVPRGDDTPAMLVAVPEKITPHLDRYAIIPVEEYERLKSAAGE